MSGDGEAWPALASNGVLNGTGPVQYTAALPDTTLADDVASGAPVVVTDTNRRRVTQVTADQNYLSETLTRVRT